MFLYDKEIFFYSDKHFCFPNFEMKFFFEVIQFKIVLFAFIAEIIIFSKLLVLQKMYHVT